VRGFVAVDVETSGLDPMRHDIMEFALVKWTVDDGPKTMEGSLAFDADLADPGALEVNGFGKREFAPAVLPQTAAMFIAGGTEDCHLVGKNPTFDATFLKRLLERYGMTPGWHHRLVDVGALAWGWWQGQIQEGWDRPEWSQPPNTDEVAEMVGIERPTVDGYHTATLDAEWAWQVFAEICPEASGRVA
jgi:DNA polymerase III alpha subunit (gram-positive type)